MYDAIKKYKVFLQNNGSTEIFDDLFNVFHEDPEDMDSNAYYLEDDTNIFKAYIYLCEIYSPDNGIEHFDKFVEYTKAALEMTKQEGFKLKKGTQKYWQRILIRNIHEINIYNRSKEIFKKHFAIRNLKNLIDNSNKILESTIFDDHGLITFDGIHWYNSEDITTRMIKDNQYEIYDSLHWMCKSLQTEMECPFDDDITFSDEMGWVLDDIYIETWDSRIKPQKSPGNADSIDYFSLILKDIIKAALSYNKYARIDLFDTKITYCYEGYLLDEDEYNSWHDSISEKKFNDICNIR